MSTASFMRIKIGQRLIVILDGIEYERDLKSFPQAVSVLKFGIDAETVASPSRPELEDCQMKLRDHKRKE